MPHLRCKDGRRVIVFDNGKQVHRNGDGSACTEEISFAGKQVKLRIVKGKPVLMQRIF